jgi:hypothetical protein
MLRCRMAFWPGNGTGKPRRDWIEWRALNLEPLAATYLPEATSRRPKMTHWQDSMVDRPETDGAAYATGWTVSGLAVLAAIIVVWVLGI